MPDKAVINYLEEKYNQNFEVISSNYLAETGKYDIRLSPKNNPNIVFKVDHNPKKDHFYDYFPYAIWQYEADQSIREFLDKYEKPYALRTGISANLEVEADNIPSYETLISEHADKVSMNIFMHLFGNTDEETLKLLLELDGHLRKARLKKVGFTTSVYHDFSIKDAEFTSLNFDFGVHTEDTFEIDNKEHFLGLIKYRINTNEEDSPKTESLIEIMVENQNHMMFKKL